MSELKIYRDDQPGDPLSTHRDPEGIARELAAIGVRFERWTAAAAITSETDNEAILAAFQSEIQKLVGEGGYQSWDVVSMHPAHPDKAALREKFLSEHTHSEDEVRFFVRGEGLFVLHVEDRVYSVRCTKDDLIAVPAKTRHWFDMGPNPTFTAIRLFTSPEGWVASYTGADIASMFPTLKN